MSSFTQNQFVDAAACGDLDEVTALLKSNDPKLTAEMINFPDKDGKNAFHYACLNDDVKLCKILLNDERVDVHMTSKNNENAYHMAALYSSMEVLHLLHKDNRVNINAQNKYGETPLHLCAGSGDKNAAKTIDLLLEYGASMTILDQWKRGPIDVSHDNSENPIVATLTKYLEDRNRCSIECYHQVQENTNAYKADTALTNELQEKERANKHKTNAKLLFGGLGGLGGLGGVKLKKTETVLKTMFNANEGKCTSNEHVTMDTDHRRSLSKLIEFPGDLEEIKAMLENTSEINPAGRDAYGICAIHKFASWNKTDYLELLLPKLTTEEVNMCCPDKKSALHYAVEMASVGAVKMLIGHCIDVNLKDKNGNTVQDILNQATASHVIERLQLALKGSDAANS